MELSKLEKFYRVHSKFYDLTRPFFLLSRKKALSSLNFEVGDRVLDLACGTGLNITYISEIVSENNITAVDYSESMLKRARVRFPNVRFIRGDVSNYEFKENFDKIVCTYSLSMIKNWEETITNARKHLSQEGVFLVLDFHSWNGIIKPIYPIFRLWLKMHGVDSDRDYVSEFRRNFKDVQENNMNFGYNQIIIAKNPKITVSALTGGAK